ncbi:aspartic proteinase nepenthesin-1 [Pyrus ussuriensis x Pyrus communis]|uniref:Aspartic proteinase nepenthesin-1 n=1 Tax=Pyrus ussuriensis x Pyrus communis TaxID=2448454 RepID=A0A5N5G6B4_9ROSA|nr:aspartic proteinase nepenthesin-1 [Pyrus ussuriensis x Pyrus communis]
MTGNSGQYFVDLCIGTPPHRLFLVFDTDSNLVWLTCSACIDCSNREPRKRTPLVFLATESLIQEQILVMPHGIHPVPVIEKLSSNQRQLFGRRCFEFDTKLRSLCQRVGGVQGQVCPG